METVQLQTLWLSYFIDKKMSHLPLIGNRLEDLLGGMACSNFSVSINSLIIYIVAFSNNTFPEKDCIIFRRKKQQLEIRINAPYDRLLQADEKETLQIIAETYLRAVETFLFNRKDFDGKKFYEDVKNLFESEGILEKKM